LVLQLIASLFTHLSQGSARRDRAHATDTSNSASPDSRFVFTTCSPAFRRTKIA